MSTLDRHDVIILTFYINCFNEIVFIFTVPLSAEAVEYADCTSAEGYPSPPTSVLDITLNCIWWWNSSLETWENVKYFFISMIPSPPWAELVVPVRVPSRGSMKLFNYLLRTIIISYLEPYSCVQIIYITQEYLINRIYFYVK